DGADVDVVTVARHAGAQGTDAPDHALHADPGPRGPVEGGDHLFVDERVGPQPYPGLVPVVGIGDLAVDPLDDPGPDPLRGHEEPPVLAHVGEAGEVVDQIGQVGGALLVGGEQADVLV